ncbi:MAG: hypothetical protein Q9219_006250 [cf. Caloplaca sp. 3 TL-2023]
MHEEIPAYTGFHKKLVNRLVGMIESRIVCEYTQFHSFLFEEGIATQRISELWYLTAHNGKRWAEIEELLREEEGAVRIWRSGYDPRRHVPPPPTPWSNEIAKAALTLEINGKVIRREIDLYANRHCLSHVAINLLVKTCDWNKLAYRIMCDRRHIDHLFPWNFQFREMMGPKIDRIERFFFQALWWNGAAGWILTEEASRWQKEREEEELDQSQVYC